MFGHDFVLMFMLAHFFKPIRLIPCMFGNKSSHLGWVMSSCCTLYFLSITWFFIPLHVKPVGLVFMCMLYDKDMHHLLCMSSPWGHFQIPIWALHLRPANASCILKQKHFEENEKLFQKRFKQYHKYFDSYWNQNKYLKNILLIVFLTWHATMLV